jgi:vacuolar iron transporter family protein
MSLQERWNEEMCSAWLYGAVAAAAEDDGKRRLFEALGKSARGQAEILAQAIRKGGAGVPAKFEPGPRARLVAALTRVLGPRRMRPMLAAMKVRGLSVYNAPPTLAAHPMPSSVEGIGERHRGPARAGSLRAAVFGANDGLVSNTSLILGVAGASDDAGIIVLTGVAGLLAGAFSMAAGEYVSVRSQRELYEHQIAQEREELMQYPEEEAEELALIYNARGIEMDEARQMAHTIFRDPDQALHTLSIEELGVNPSELGSPWSAALSSFVAFAAGAFVPLLPFAVHPAAAANVVTSVCISALALFAVGAAMSLFSGKSAAGGGVRMLLIGSGAGLVTYLVGRLLGVGLA